jgi:histidinol dehydrogenase
LLAIGITSSSIADLVAAGVLVRVHRGLSVAKFLKTLTCQRIDADDGVCVVAPHVAEISRAGLMPAHEATATKRLDRLPLRRDGVTA